jgi:hypothetical protein
VSGGWWDFGKEAVMRRFYGKRFLCGAFLSLAAAASVGFLWPSRLEADGTVPGLLAQLNGDVNADAARDLTDAVYLLEYIFRGGPAPRPLVCEPAAEWHNGDMNESGFIDVSDPVYLLNWLFLDGKAPTEGCPLRG